jgi:thiosulfate dehydrogenase [quinone] large subunit
MSRTASERALIVFFRLTMAWTFLYAASHQVFVTWSVAEFLNSTKTFHPFYVHFTGPAIAPVLTFLVGYGHLLIGLSLLLGLAVRLSSIFGIALMLLYWTAHMDFPYIGNNLNFIVDEHIVFAGVLVLLIVERAGHIWGLDGWAGALDVVRRQPFLRWAVA